jgi:hypothetical protein
MLFLTERLLRGNIRFTWALAGTAGDSEQFGIDIDGMTVGTDTSTCLVNPDVWGREEASITVNPRSIDKIVSDTGGCIYILGVCAFIIGQAIEAHCLFDSDIF